jgi:hypothetical protein
MGEAVPTDSEIDDAANKVLDAAVQARSSSFTEAARYWEQFREKCAWIPGKFKEALAPFPMPDASEKLAQSMLEVANMLDHRKASHNLIEDNIEKTRTHLVNWSGYTADTFTNEFIVIIPTTAKNQAFVAGILQEAMIADKDIIERGRRDILGIANRAVVALEAITKSGGGTITLALGIVGAIFTVAGGVAGLPFFGALGPVAGAGFNAVVGASSGAALGASTAPEQNDLSADTEDGVLTKMSEALARIEKVAAEQRQKVEKMLLDTYMLFSNDKALFVAPRPGLIDDSKSPDVADSFLPP